MKLGLLVENNEIIWHRLMMALAGFPLERVVFQHRGGWQSVLESLEPALESMSLSRLELALVAIDQEDCGRHDPVACATRHGSGCRFCQLRARIDTFLLQRKLPIHVCLAVPAPAIEVWFAAAREPTEADPERYSPLAPSTPVLELAKWKGRLKTKVWGVRRPGRERKDERREALLESLLSARASVATRCRSFRAFEEGLARALEAISSRASGGERSQR